MVEWWIYYWPNILIRKNEIGRNDGGRPEIKHSGLFLCANTEKKLCDTRKIKMFINR